MRSKMSSFQAAILGVYIIFVLESIRFVNAREDTSPIYFKIESEKYQFIYNVVYNAKDKGYDIQAPNDIILVACPSMLDDSDFFIVRKIVHNDAKVLPICEKPNKPSISTYASDDQRKGDFRRIGFVIKEPTPEAFDIITESTEISFESDFPKYEKPLVDELETINEDGATLPVSDLPLERTSSEKRNQLLETSETDQVPEYTELEKSLSDKSDELNDKSEKNQQSESPALEKSPSDEFDELTEKNKPKQKPVRPPGDYQTINLIVFKYDASLNRIKFAWYNIIPGKYLNSDISFKTEEIFETNEDIYGYNVDSLYSAAAESAAGNPYLKVSLAPEDDFLFKYMKLASRQNILTAPMRYNLLRHWQNLEKFTRKVTKIIDSVAVMAGIHGTLTQLDKESEEQPIYLHDGEYPIPSLFWKLISIEYVYEEKVHRNGILFLLHNVDPNANQNIKKICPDDEDAVSNTGWELPNEDKFKRLMYACLWNSANMAVLGEEEEYLENEVFNLNAVPMIRIEQNGEKILETVNVIDEIKKNSGLNAVVNNFANAFSYTFKFLANCLLPE